MRRRSPHSAVGLAWRIPLIVAGLALTIVLCWLLFAVSFVLSSPRILGDAWQDWRFHKRRSPDCPYTLRSAVWMQIVMWADEKGIR